MLPVLWPRVLDAVADAFSSDGATLVLKSTTLSSIAVSTSIAPFVPLYMSGPIRDPRERRVNPSAREAFMPDYAYFSPQEIAREPYYQEFLRPNGFGWNAVAMLHGDLMISVKRGFNRGPYEGADLEALNKALPCMRLISRIACMTWQSHFEGQLSAFDRLRRGAFLLDARARVLQTNGSVRFGDGLDVVDGRIQVPCGADRDKLRKFLAALLARDASIADPPPTLMLPRPSGARPLLLDGIACTNSIRSLHSRAAALVLITDLGRTLGPKSETLRAVFGMSRTESGLACALVAGDSVQEAASRLSISEDHARQRLKAIFHKTGTSRQGELVALLARLA
jgi:DNA-binding CsgD family transcriptional regulator